MTKAQKWARERNSAKWRLKGIRENLKMLARNSSLLITERKELKRSVIFIDETLSSWKARNGLAKKKFMEEK